MHQMLLSSAVAALCTKCYCLVQWLLYAPNVLFQCSGCSMHQLLFFQCTGCSMHQLFCFSALAALCTNCSVSVQWLLYAPTVLFQCSGCFMHQLFCFSAVAALCTNCSGIETPYILLTQFICVSNMTINVYYFCKQH